MDTLSLILAVILPSGAVLFAMYLTIKTFLGKDFEKRLIELKLKNNELIIPMRLQAYERLALLLERISPNNLILRVNNPEYNVAQLHQQLLTEIRNEFNHNLAQQIYVSDDSWKLIKKAVEDLNASINNASQAVDKEARGIELAKKIFEHYMALEQDSLTLALGFMKNEIRRLY